MKFILLLLLFSYCIKSTAQKNKSFGIEGGYLRSSTQDDAKKLLFSSSLGVQVVYRNNINNHDFLNYTLGTTIGNNSLYDLQFFRFGYEAVDVIRLKNLFIMPAIFINRFNSKQNENTEISFGPSLTSGFNFHIASKIKLRVSTHIDYNIPSKVVSFTDGFNLGAHYSL